MLPVLKFSLFEMYGSTNLTSYSWHVSANVLALRPNTCIKKLFHHWFRKSLMCFVPSHYWNQCWLGISCTLVIYLSQIWIKKYVFPLVDLLYWTISLVYLRAAELIFSPPLNEGSWVCIVSCEVKVSVFLYGAETCKGHGLNGLRWQFRQICLREVLLSLISP